MTCGTINNFSACVPMIPDIINCTTSAECYGDLTCEGTAGKAVCTKVCNTTADCNNDAALGPNFYCSGVCLPKVAAGNPAPSEEACLGGKSMPLVTGGGVKCVSPPGWACTANDQCLNGQCDQISGANFGRCR
jgi:hypothetical protein